MPTYLIQVCPIPFGPFDSIPDTAWKTVARCKTVRGTLRRFDQEYAATHDGSGWSGHVRILTDHGSTVQSAWLRLEVHIENVRRENAKLI